MTTPTVPGKVVDLSLLVAEELPCSWPNHMPYQQKTYNYFAEAGSPEGPLTSAYGEYQTRFVIMDEHTGTHMDAPAHFLPREETGLPAASPLGDVTADAVDLEQLMGPAVVIDVTELIDEEPGPGISPTIEPRHIEAWEAEHGPIQAGDVVLLRSDWDARHYRKGAAGSGYARDPFLLRTTAGWPAPGPEAMQLLVARGVRCVGTDGPSMGSTHDGAPVHHVALANGCVFVEALGNLAALPPRGATFVFAPLKLARGTGAPGRAFAFLP